MRKDTEGVTTILNDEGSLIAIIRRDPVTKANKVHMTPEASVDQITDLMVPFSGIGA